MLCLVHLAIDGKSHRPRFGRGAESGRLALDVGHEVQLKRELGNGRGRVEAALAMDVADRPPVGAWGHTYHEEWSPEALAAITVERARRLGWDFVKFQPRASCFAEAFGSVYHPSGHRLRAPILIQPAVPDLQAWSSVQLVDRKALDDQVESIAIVARGLGSDVPVIQTVFSPITVGGYLVGKSQSRVVRELRKHPEIVGPALDRIAADLLDFRRRSLEPGARGLVYANASSDDSHVARE